MHTGFQPVLQLRGPDSVVCHANQKCLLRHIVTYCHYCAATAETRRPGDQEQRVGGAGVCHKAGPTQQVLVSRTVSQLGARLGNQQVSRIKHRMK